MPTKMREARIEIGEGKWLNPEPLMVLADHVNRELNSALLSYRKALRGYEAAYPTQSEGTSRQNETLDAQREAIKALVAEGVSAEDIFRRIGEAKTMPNVFAGEVVETYFDLVTERQDALITQLKFNSDQLIAWLDKSESVEADPAKGVLMALDES